MFCHNRYSLFVSLEKKQHDRLNTCEETMGQKEVGERTDHRLRRDRLGDATRGK
jgi:hypothetical protein